ncbi:hypothetical protein R3W88_024946 [Solanum pinnatisectum]|uniref:Uncharacterized protein n=1 Tax=Solanum pinnatisectum TaxID=50273 RepID=A0AAV9M2M7_9SOLN|nr:hypothetical protein R3W88_024946 [Solanum pinnatisectum]
MSRGMNDGGGQGSLSYPFGNVEPINNFQTTRNQENEPINKAASKSTDNTKNVPADIHSSNTNNYFSW